MKTSQTGYKIARDYVLVINVSYFSLIAIANVATAFVFLNAQFEAENTQNFVFPDTYACRLNRIDAIT